MTAIAHAGQALDDRCERQIASTNWQVSMPGTDGVTQMNVSSEWRESLDGIEKRRRFRHHRGQVYDIQADADADTLADFNLGFCAQYCLRRSLAAHVLHTQQNSRRSDDINGFAQRLGERTHELFLILIMM